MTANLNSAMSQILQKHTDEKKGANFLTQYFFTIQCKHVYTFLMVLLCLLYTYIMLTALYVIYVCIYVHKYVHLIFL